MRKIVLLLLLLMVACAPSAPTVNDTDTKAPSEPQVNTQEQVVSPPVAKTEEVKEEVTGTPVEPTGSPIDPYTELGCEKLLSADEFGKECNQSADNLVVTYKIGTRNCVVNIKDRQNERLTAGFTLTGYADDVAAEKEFDRRLVVLKVGADKSVGERAYLPPMKLADRESMEFLDGKFIVEGGTDTRLCSKDGLFAVAKIIDGRIK